MRKIVLVTSEELGSLRLFNHYQQDADNGWYKIEDRDFLSKNQTFISDLVGNGIIVLDSDDLHSVELVQTLIERGSFRFKLMPVEIMVERYQPKKNTGMDHPFNIGGLENVPNPNDPLSENDLLIPHPTTEKVKPKENVNLDADHLTNISPVITPTDEVQIEEWKTNYHVRVD